jgi:phosphoglycerate dehydrogenase-like enzyme
MRILMPRFPGLELPAPEPPAAPDLRWEVTRWDGTGDLPPEASAAEMWVAPFGAPDHAAIVARLPRLRLVQLLTAGHDNVAALEAVTLCSAAGLHDGAVAEWGMAAILAQLRALPIWLADQPHGRRSRFESGTLAGATVVLVGYGGIGQAIERRLAGFEAEVVRVASRPRPGVHGADELAGLLPVADVVVLAVPLTDATRRLLGAAQLAALPDGALVVNLARGEVVDQEALVAELAAGRLRAALDVSVPDPLPPDSPLRALPGLLYTPHIAGATSTIFPRLSRFIADQARRLGAGEPLANVVSGPDRPPSR